MFVTANILITILIISPKLQTETGTLDLSKLFSRKKKLKDKRGVNLLKNLGKLNVLRQLIYASKALFFCVNPF